MGHSIAVMNTKGGVGKSTVVMALAETLSEFHKKNVLVVDSDSQTSISTMLMHVSRWEQLERQHKTIVDYLSKMVLGSGGEDWKSYIATGVSDLDDSQSVYLVPSHMELSLFEREISAQKREQKLRDVIKAFLAETKRMFDFVIIDCPPGLSVLTECWLRECDYFLPPTKPDYLAVRGLAILKRFREISADAGFAQLLGVLINLKDARISSEEDWHRKLAADPANKCFQTAIPRRAYIQRAADFEPSRRTYIAKYPGDAGQTIRLVTAELLARIEGRAFELPKPQLAPQAERPVPAPEPQPRPPARQPAPPPPSASSPSMPAARAQGPAVPVHVNPPSQLSPAAAPQMLGPPSPAQTSVSASVPAPVSVPVSVSAPGRPAVERPASAAQQAPARPVNSAPSPARPKPPVMQMAPAAPVTKPPSDERPLDLVSARPAQQGAAQNARAAEPVSSLGAPVSVGARSNSAPPLEQPIALGPAKGGRPAATAATSGPAQGPAGGTASAVNGNHAPPTKPAPAPMTLGTPERMAPPPGGFSLRRPQIARTLLGIKPVIDTAAATVPSGEAKSK